mmetsp:Transcript_8730/g.30500  ORF Transcript_8730/g.30500 Transcript_8730/m.30500 type:complete len:84 (+) Transcript_8730:207-458(+)
MIRTFLCPPTYFLKTDLWIENVNGIFDAGGILILRQSTSKAYYNSDTSLVTLQVGENVLRSHVSARFCHNACKLLICEACLSL